MGTDADGRVSLLIVDDEPGILSALTRCLRREGYELLTASTPDEALRLLDERPVDLILTDQKMPMMSGLEFLGEAAKRRPEASRVMISGWSEALPRERLDAIGVSALIPKPWDDGELKETLRAVARGETRPAPPENDVS